MYNWLFHKSLNTCKKEKECFASYASKTKFSRHTLWTVYEMIQQHKDPIESEIQGQVSIFCYQKLWTLHFIKKKVQEKKLHRNDLMFKAYRAAYWLVKEKVWNPNFSSLANLQTYFGFHEMKNFQYSAQSSIGVIFLVISSSFDDNLLGKYREQIALVS